MNTRRIIFWLCFVVVLGLIIWGMVVAMNKKPPEQKYNDPVPVSASDHVKGPSDAQITVIEYSDFQCPACQAYYPLVTRLLNEASTTVKFVYRHFPLGQHKNARAASEASEAAHIQGKFWEMYALLFSGHTEWETLADPMPVFERYADSLDLDLEKFKSDIKSDAVKNLVESQRKEGETVGIAFTPSFFVNGKILNPNPQSYDLFKAAVVGTTTGSQN